MVYPTKRSEERMGHAKVAGSEQPEIDKIQFEEAIRVPDPGPNWSPIALYLWEGVLKSPMKKYWTATDYGFAWVACEAVDVAVKGGKAMHLTAAESLMRNALFNEADRRKARIELTRKMPGEETGNPVVKNNVAQFRSRRAASE